MQLSVVVTTFNRKNELLHTLEQLKRQKGVAFEIIVVDNCSSDDTAAAVKGQFPDVRVFSLPSNTGTYARNFGAEKAEAEIVVFFDDDVYPTTDYELSKLPDLFDTEPFPSCLAFRVLNAATGGLETRSWGHPRSYHEYASERFETDCITEGASAFRKDHFLAVGGYFAPLFIGEEGADLALRLIRQNFRITYEPSVEVFHSHSHTGRVSWRSYYFYARNDIWIAWRSLPVTDAFRFLARGMGMLVLSGVRYGMLRHVARGVLDSALQFKEAGVTRDPLTREARAYLNEIQSSRHSIWFSIKKHLRNREL